MSRLIKNVVITGISGFIGSNIVPKLLSEGYIIIGIIRDSTDLWRCTEYLDDITIFNKTDTKLKEALHKLDDYTLIHSSWYGVEANLRENWQVQSQNISYLIDILDLTSETKLKKIIFLGSQAEYGKIDKIVDENFRQDVISAYGVIKSSLKLILESYCTQHRITWIWLRVFSIFGPKENPNWLIPSLIIKMRNEESMSFSSCEQHYAYMYVNDLSSIIEKTILLNIESGIYNVCGNEPKPLKETISKIRDIVNPSFELKFGDVPDRENQSMYLVGSIEKLQRQIGEINFTDFNTAINETISYYQNLVK